MARKKNKEIPAPKKSKEERLFQNILTTTKQFMQGKSFVPMTAHELIARLGIPEQHHPLFHAVLQQLVKERFAEIKGGYYSYINTTILVLSGVMKMHPRGFGFLQADNPNLFPEDVFVPKHFTGNAVDGDRVEVEVNTQSISEKGPEGRVVSILSRSRTHMAGTILKVEKFGDILAYVPLLGASQRVVVHTQADQPLKVGDRIVMEVVDWGSKNAETIGRFSHYLGHISDPSCDIPAAIEEYELRKDFPHPVIEEAERFGNRVSTKEIAQREDLRQLECFTIDPDTAKDFDDALSVTKDKKGYHLGVHIADVSHYVRVGSALDEEARQRCNSTYFPGYCLPMLPSVLSDNLCSLKPNVNRLTVSVFIDFDFEGNMQNYRIARTVIKSAKRFTYREAKAVLDGTKKSIHRPTLILLTELCALLKRKRYERGSIEFSLPELVVMVDEKGIPYKTDYIEYDITHQMVEEFMLKANETVATHLSKLGKNLTYRIHDAPAEENMRDFALLANAFGFKISDKPSPAEIQKLFDEALETSYGSYLATSYIRRMRLAAYSPDNIGHYGLGLTHYCHFTSPIRRYVDLVSHRILFGDSDNREDLANIATQCSNQERISSKAENHVVMLKKLRLLAEINKKDPSKQFDAIVTKIKPFGLYFEITDLMLEGFLHISELGDDYYVFQEAEMSLSGRYQGERFVAGERITVMLKTIDLILLESQWNLVGTEEPVRMKRATSKKGSLGKSKKGQKREDKKQAFKKGSKRSQEKKRKR